MTRQRTTLERQEAYRRGREGEAAAESVAHHYATNGEDIRIDVILLAPGQKPHHIENAWMPFS